MIKPGFGTARRILNIGELQIKQTPPVLGKKMNKHEHIGMIVFLKASAVFNTKYIKLIARECKNKIRECEEIVVLLVCGSQNTADSK